MRKYLVNVNGIAYEVAVEELTGAQIPSAPAVAAPAVAPAAEQKEESAPASVPVAAAAGQLGVNAPMPGTILSVAVKPGDAVKKHQVLMVLEAMKMENEIVAPQAGVIVGVNVAAGASVNTGAALCVIG